MALPGGGNPFPAASRDTLFNPFQCYIEPFSGSAVCRPGNSDRNATKRKQINKSCFRQKESLCCPP
jgi:hypothetical protein